MSEKLVLRKENDLPADVRALLHGPPPEGVWYVASRPRIGNPFRFAAAIALALLIGTLGLFVMDSLDSLNRGRFRSEGFVITLSLVLVSAAFYWLCRHFKNKAVRLEADLQAGRVRYGLWLTAQHMLTQDYEGVACARRQDIATTEIYYSGRPRLDILVLTLTNRQTIRVIVKSLDGWDGQAEGLLAELQKRLAVTPGVIAHDMQNSADFYLPHQKFSDFIRWLDGEAQRLKSSAPEKAALLAMANTALASWPDKARSASDNWFMMTEQDGTYEYGVNNAYIGGGTIYRGFTGLYAPWYLALCRTVYFNEAESIFPDVTSVQLCAETFKDVPLTAIEFTGDMNDDVFDAFLAWAATKPLKNLTACNYSTERSSLLNLREPLKKKLADFKIFNGLA